jgi:hypothetical protein
VVNDPKPVKKQVGTRTVLVLFYVLPFLLVLGVCGYIGYAKWTHKPPPHREISVKPFATVKIKDLTAGLYGQGQSLMAGGNDLFIEFHDAQGKLVDVGDVTFELDLHMPQMVMHNTWKVLKTSTPGQYRASVEPQLAGDWTCKLSFGGPVGKAEATLPLRVAP